MRSLYDAFNVEVLKSLSFCRLAAEEKRLRKSPFATHLEGSKVLVPKTIRSLGFRLAPQFELIQIAAVIFRSRSRSNR